MSEERRTSYPETEREFHELERSDSEIYNGASRQVLTEDESDYIATRRSEVALDETGWKHTTRGVVHNRNADRTQGE